MGEYHPISITLYLSPYIRMPIEIDTYTDVRYVGSFKYTFFLQNIVSLLGLFCKSPHYISHIYEVYE